METLQSLRADIRQLQVAVAGPWTTVTAKTRGQFTSPTFANGFYYLAISPGTTAAIEPTWPTTIGGRVTDGTVVWECAGRVDTF